MNVSFTVSANSLAVAYGANTQVQYNDSGVFGANAEFTFDKTTGTVAVSNTVSSNNLNLTSSRTTTFTFTSSNTGTNIIDTFAITDFRAADYFISIKDNTANGYQSTRLMILHDGTNEYITEYGMLYTNAQLGIFSVTSNTTYILLNYTSTVSTNSALTGHKTMIST